MNLTTVSQTSAIKGLYISIALALSLPLPVTVSQSVVAQTIVAQTIIDQSQYTQVIYVDPRKGDDQRGQGNQRSPFRTITQALMVAQPKTMILLAPGTYSEQTGENFPLMLNQDVIIQGNPTSQGKNFVIEGNGFFVSRTAAGQNVTIAATRKAGGIVGVTVTNLHARGHGIWIESTNPVISHNTLTRNGNTGVSVNGNSAPIISNNYFFNNTGNGLLVYDQSKPRVENNEFYRTGFGVSAVKNSAPILVGNTFRDNRIGIMLEGNSTAILRRNTITNSTEIGLMTIAQANADLGTAQEVGGNIFRANRQLDIKNSSATQVITAFGNQINGKTAGNIDVQGNTVPFKVASSQNTTKNLPATVNLSRKTNFNMPPLPTKQPPREVIRVSGASTPTTTVVSSEKAIASNRSLPAPPPLSEPYRAQSNARGIDSNYQPLLSTNTNSSISTSNFARNSNNRVMEIKQPSNSSPPPPPTPTPSSSSTSRRYSNSNAPRRTLTDILVVAPNASNAPAPPSLTPTRSQNFNDNAYAPRARSSQYKVIVEARNSYQESQVRSLYPDAFRTNYKGRSMLQVGVFSTRQNAQQVLQNLKRAGLGALIIQ